jgi:choline kinase
MSTIIHKYDDLTVILLVAGQGTRLMPLTDNKPKCMVEVSGKSIIQRQLDLFKKMGIKKIIAVTGYMQEKIEDPTLVKVYNPEFAVTNMIYSLFCAENYLNGNVVISYGDIIYSEKALSTLLESQDDIVIACDDQWQSYWGMRFDDPLTDAETFIKQNGNRVKSLGAKAKNISEIEGQYIGLIKLTDEGCSKFRDAYHICMSQDECSKNAWNSNRPLKKAYMTDLLNFFAQKNELHYTSIQRGWFEIDDIRDLEIADMYIHELND